MSVSNLTKRIIPCLDVAGGRTVKGVKFTGLRDMGDPVELARRYEEDGADELMFLDISATHEDRKTVFHLVEDVAHKLSIPFTVGGGISDLADVKRLLNCGADKVSVNSAAVKRPDLIREISHACGSQCCVLAIDARRRKGAFNEAVDNTGVANLTATNEANDLPVYEVLVQGGRVNTGLNAFNWALKGVENGAGEILLTSWDRDGTEEGFDLELTKLFAEKLPVPVIASGGAGGPESFLEVFTEAHADAALAATIFHDGRWTANALKQEIKKAHISVRT